jgi:hypothetical protein
MHSRARSVTLTSALLIGRAAALMTVAPVEAPPAWLHGAARITLPARLRAWKAA